MQRINHTASNEAKDLAATQADLLLQNLQSKTVQEIETYFRDNSSNMAFLTDAEIDTTIDGANTIAKMQQAMKMLAKDNAFQIRNQLLQMKLLMVLAKQSEII